jgi:hypothetical protein
MTENSRFWDGTVVGDAVEAPYNAPDEFAAVLRSLNGANANTSRSGVCRGELNTLTCTGAATPISVNTGRAFVHGSWYESDASISFNIADPNPNSRIDTLVLRKTWSTQQVRLAIKTGSPSATPSAPALVQDAVTLKIWEFPLYDIYVASGGAITLVDRREYVPYLSSQYLERILDTTLLADDDIVTLNLPGTVYRFYVLVVDARKAAAGVATALSVYFTPTTLTGYSYGMIEGYGAGTLAYVTGFNTWRCVVGSVSMNTYPNSRGLTIAFFTNLLNTLDKNIFSLSGHLTAYVGASVATGAFEYAGPVSQINIIKDDGNDFITGSRFTLYGVL